MTELSDIAGGPFSVIYADSPWLFRTWSAAGEGKAPQNHYDCMTIDALCDLPVRRIAARDALLFLWVYQPMLPEAMSLMRAWGFDFVTVGYFWIKTRTPSLRDGVNPFPIGLGRYTRAGAEQCWIGKRGRGLPRVSASEPQLVFAPRREHSRKPDEIAASIERLTGDTPRIELFARQNRPGWTVWGNETAKFDRSAVA